MHLALILLNIFEVTSTSIFNQSSHGMARQNVYAIYSRHENFEERAGYGPCLPEVGPDPVHIFHLVLCLLQGGGGSKQGGWGKGVGGLSVATTAALKDHRASYIMQIAHGHQLKKYEKITS